MRFWPFVEKVEFGTEGRSYWISLNEIITTLKEITNKNIISNYGPERLGDIKHSKASIENIIEYCDYNPTVQFDEGLKINREF